MNALLPLLAGLATACLCTGLTLSLVTWQSRRRKLLIERRLLQVTSTDYQIGQFSDDQDWRHQAIAQGAVLDRWFGDTKGESTERLLAQAGWRSLSARGLFYLIHIILPVALAGAALVSSLILVPDNRLYALLAAIAGFAVGGLLPRYALRARAQKRRAQIKAEVPIMINLLVLLFEAGLGIRQTLNTLVREGGSVLTTINQELFLVMRQVEAGASLNETLHACARTLDVAELESVVGILLQVNRYGGEIREPLLEALKLIEERRSLDLREKVNAMSGRMTVTMVLFFFPALLICVAGPAFTSIIKVLGTTQ